MVSKCGVLVGNVFHQTDDEYVPVTRVPVPLGSTSKMVNLTSRRLHNRRSYFRNADFSTFKDRSTSRGLQVDYERYHVISSDRNFGRSVET